MLFRSKLLDKADEVPIIDWILLGSSRHTHAHTNPTAFLELHVPVFFPSVFPLVCLIGKTPSPRYGANVAVCVHARVRARRREESDPGSRARFNPKSRILLLRSTVLPHRHSLAQSYEGGPPPAKTKARLQTERQIRRRLGRTSQRPALRRPGAWR